MAGIVWAAAVVGAVTGYLALAGQRLERYQSRMRWIPALVLRGDVGGLFLVLVCVLGGAAASAAFVWSVLRLITSVG